MTNLYTEMTDLLPFTIHVGNSHHHPQCTCNLCV